MYSHGGKKKDEMRLKIWKNFNVSYVLKEERRYHVYVQGGISHTESSETCDRIQNSRQLKLVKQLAVRRDIIETKTKR